MKKHGFTLTELLVTLGIIGVVAAILAPTLGNLMPDKNKATVLKVYKNISEITDDLLKDSTIYYRGGTDCEGLACRQQPRVAPYNTTDYEGTKKYVSLLAAHLQTVGKPVFTNGNGEASFTTLDGIDWHFNLSQKGVLYTLTIDVNGEGNGKDCFFSSNCSKPDRFKFYIPESGKIEGLDSLTLAYLNNPLKLNDKKTDLAYAKDLEKGSQIGYGKDVETGVDIGNSGKPNEGITIDGIEQAGEDFKQGDKNFEVDTDQPEYWHGPVKPVEEINYDDNGFKKREDTFLTNDDVYEVR